MVNLAFIGISYILVYVGAVSILFLFILMLINIRISELLSKSNNYLPLAILCVISFVYILGQNIPFNKEVKFNNLLNTVAAISGFVTKIEAPTFAKNPEIYITLSCNDPLLRAVDLVNVDVSSLDPSATTITDDESTAPHGFSFTVVFTATSPTFLIKDAVFPTWQFEIFLIEHLYKFRSDIFRE